MPIGPTNGDLHINQPLTNLSVAYFQDKARFLASSVFPTVPVEKRGDIYYKYSKSDWRRTDAQKRAPATESAGTGWHHTTDQYYCDVFAVHKDIDDQDRANADSYWQLDSTATRLVTNQLLLKRELDWSARYFKTGLWATEWTGVATGPTANQFLQFDQAASDPLGVITAIETTFDELNGFEVNFMVVGAYVWRALKNHPAILDRIKYTQKGVVTKELVAEFFEVEKFAVARASSAAGPAIPDSKAQDAAATYSYIHNKKGVLLGYAPPSPSIETPSAGYVFTWKGYSPGNRDGLRVKQFRKEEIESDRVEGSTTYDMKVVSTDCAVWMNSVVA